MLDIPEEIARRGGAAKAIELLAAGGSRSSIRRALRAGLIRRPRKGWYVLPSTPPALRGAVRVGGRATCVTAMRELGIWVTEIPRVVHVAVHRSTSQLRSVADPGVRQVVFPDAVVHWRDTAKPREAAGSRLVEPILKALVDARDCLSDEDLFASAESVRRRGLARPEEWDRLLKGMPRSVRRILATAGDKSDSGLESLVIFRLRGRGRRVRQQLQIGRDRVDLVIGSRLIVELDGAGFHDRYADYRRDARLTAAGYTVLRFDYDQVLFEWPSILSAIEAAVSRGLHLA